MRANTFRTCSLLRRKPAMLADSLAGRLMEIYQKSAIGRVHLELSLGSTCFRLFPGNQIRPLHVNATRMRESRGRAPTPQSKENDHDEI
jgi:hypothetical protein